jgi:hypothetical protein
MPDLGNAVLAGARMWAYAEACGRRTGAGLVLPPKWQMGHWACDCDEGDRHAVTIGLVSDGKKGYVFDQSLTIGFPFPGLEHIPQGHPARRHM